MGTSAQKHDMKRENLCKVFRAIQKNGPLERKQIQQLTGLSWGAVSQFISALVGSGIVRQERILSGNVGKAPLILDISSSNNYIVGVDFGFNVIRVLVMDLKGDIMKSRMVIPGVNGRILESLLSVLDSTLEEYLGKKNILAFSISTQGNIDVERGVALYLTFDPSWRNLNLKEALEEHFHIPAYVFHDPDCVLAAEKYFGHVFREEYRNVVTLNTNYGLGMSLMIDSRIYNSTRGRSGEFGHITVVPNGALCSCGKRGCLEAYASKTGVLNRFVEAVNNGASTKANLEDSFGCTYEMVRECAANGDKLSLDVYEQAGRLLGRSLASLASVLDPDAIILYGEFANDNTYYRDVMEAEFQNHIYPGIEVPLLFSDLGASAAAQGAAFLAMDKILSDFLMEKTAMVKSKQIPE